MRSGLICVAPRGPRAGGSQHSFHDGVHGFQYDRDDVDGAVQCLEKCIGVGTGWQAACVARGRRFSWQRSMDQLLQFYDVVLRARGLLQDGKNEGLWPGEELPDEE